jgi:hypothetical protein
MWAAFGQFFELWPFLAWPNRRCDAGPGSQRLINHNCFNSINDVSTGVFARAWNLIVKRMNSLGYFHRDVGSSNGPPQARIEFTRVFAMP